MQYRIIKSQAQYKSYESYLEKLLWITKKTPAEQGTTDQLIALISAWDKEHQTVSAVIPKLSAPDPIQALDKLMKEHKVNSSDLASALGLSQSGMSDILNYRTALSPNLISKLSEKFKLPNDFFHVES